jgi:hypothetical protein
MVLGIMAATLFLLDVLLATIFECPLSYALLRWKRAIELCQQALLAGV